jgi:hypothetical protein
MRDFSVMKGLLLYPSKAEAVYITISEPNYLSYIHKVMIVLIG